MNFVPCLAWVSRGKAASVPHKFQLSPEEMKRLVEETKEICRKDSIQEIDEEDDASETEQDEDHESVEECEQDVENDDFDSRYNLDSYDNDDEENPLFTINQLAVHVDNHDDDYLTDQESEGDIEEKEDFSIKDSDNLLIVGHVEDSSSVLEVYVYNQDEDAFYVHHDIVLPSYPLALAWLDFHPSDDIPGNYVAVGNMSPVVEIWDLDVIDVLESEYTLGKASKKKKTKMMKTGEMKCHSDAVLSLSWNRQIRNLLASGSADSSVIVWDLEEGSCLNHLSFHSNKVQALEWHPTESQFLLSGCTDGFIKLYDCRSDNEAKSWKVDGEIEKLTWSIADSFKFLCSTDQGYIHSIDMRKDEIDYSFQAHNEAVTGLDISYLKPDVLISASMDKTLKAWDLSDNFKMIKSMKLKVGSIYTAKCAPDLDLTVAVGGNNESNSLKIVEVFKENKKKSNDDFNEVKAKSENELQTRNKSNKRIIYEKSNDDFEEVKVKKENELKTGNKSNTRIIYEKSNDDFGEAKVKSENELQTRNKRIIYEKSNDDFGEVKSENELQIRNKTNKRIIYEKSNDDFEEVKVKKENKLKTGNKSNTRIIYDTEENYESKVQDSKNVLRNHTEHKKFKRKK